MDMKKIWGERVCWGQARTSLQWTGRRISRQFKINIIKYLSREALSSIGRFCWCSHFPLNYNLSILIIGHWSVCWNTKNPANAVDSVICFYLIKYEYEWWIWKMEIKTKKNHIAYLIILDYTYLLFWSLWSSSCIRIIESTISISFFILSVDTYLLYLDDDLFWIWPGIMFRPPCEGMGTLL